MRYLLLNLIFVFVLKSSMAQDNDNIQHIRNIYYDIVKLISESREKQYEGSLYCNTTEINKYNRAWRAVGVFKETVELWYSDDPTIGLEERPQNVLKMAVVNGESAAFGYYKEFLFENGELIFAFTKYRNEGDADELRYYFKNGELINFKANNDNLQAETSTIKAESISLINMFLKQFGL